jgi:hypothetical protein
MEFEGKHRFQRGIGSVDKDFAKVAQKTPSYGTSSSK